MSKYSANHVAQRHIINFRVIAYYDEISRFNIIHNYNMKNNERSTIWKIGIW